MPFQLPHGTTLADKFLDGAEDVITPEALAFVVGLQRAFNARRLELLEARQTRAAALRQGKALDFLPETASIRAGDWKVAALPADLQDRRVEITGPVDRKMVINALNSGANVFMADFEDSNSPTWDNCIQGQRNLRDAIRRTIDFRSDNGKQYALKDRTAVLFVRPRGWHLEERHVTVDGLPVSGSLWDFGLYFFHNAEELKDRDSGPYFYLPKLESHLEARLWNDVFVHAQKELGISQGSVRATVLIETLPAAFEMDEILYELRNHSAGLNCGRWDYIFSFIKKLSADPTAVMPDRNQVTMTQHFLRSYVLLLIKTCHRRGAQAMGGMAAQIPIKDNAAANEEAFAKVRADKLREVTDGHDGTWVAHPGLVPVAREIFDAHMKTPNQISRQRDDVNVTAADLLTIPPGTRTEDGLRQNIRVGVQYLEAWLRGSGCVPLYNLMEDAATAEISRAQLWQWMKHKVVVGSSKLDAGRFDRVLDEEMAYLERALGPDKMANAKLRDARDLFAALCKSPEFEEFLTVPAYARVLELEQGAG
jgi:malate synthase